MNPFGSVPDVATARHDRRSGIADDIDFEIKGTEMQFVEIELDPGESAIAEAGAMMFKDARLSAWIRCLATAHRATRSGAFLGKTRWGRKTAYYRRKPLHHAFSPMKDNGKARVAFAAPYPGHILAMRLDDTGWQLGLPEGQLSLLLHAGSALGIFFQRKVMTGLFGGEGFIMQKPGRGWMGVCACRRHDC